MTPGTLILVVVWEAAATYITECVFTLLVMLVIISETTEKGDTNKTQFIGPNIFSQVKDFMMASSSSSSISPILPGGGKVTLKGRVSVVVSAMNGYRKLAVIKNGDQLEIKSFNSGEAVEIYSIANGKGSHTLEHVSVTCVWGCDMGIKFDEEVILVPGEVEMESGTQIRFLIAEVRKGVRKEDVLATLSDPEVLKWLGICDLAVIEDKNVVRRQFRALSRAAEGMVTLVTGPSTRDLTSFPSKLTLARTIAEQYTLLTNSNVSNLFVAYSYDTMKVMAILDTDCTLILTVLTMLSFKWNLFTGHEWRRIGATDSYDISWPVLSCSRK